MSRNILHNKQNRLIESGLVVAKGRDIGGLGDKDKGIKKYWLIVTK